MLSFFRKAAFHWLCAEFLEMFIESSRTFHSSVLEGTRALSQSWKLLLQPSSLPHLKSHWLWDGSGPEWHRVLAGEAFNFGKQMQTYFLWTLKNCFSLVCFLYSTLLSFQTPILYQAPTPVGYRNMCKCSQCLTNCFKTWENIRLCMPDLNTPLVWAKFGPVPFQSQSLQACTCCGRVDSWTDFSQNECN